MSFYDDASLVLLAGGAAGKDGKVYNIKPISPAKDFTFTRGTNLTATRVGKDGYIEKGRENLLLQSNQFDTTWFLNSASLTSGQAGYDGSNDAWELKATGDGATNLARVTQTISLSGVSTFSVYVKAGNVSWVRLNALTSGTNVNNYFDLSGSGAVGASPSSTVIESTITSVGNGWFRISVASKGQASISEVRIQVAEADGDDIPATNSYIYIQDAQLEQGLVATDYIETGATTATAGLLEDEPRFDYTGGGCPALLMEIGRTNYIDHSEYGGGYEQVDSNLTVTDNAEVSPEGLNNAVKIEDISTSSATQAVKFGALESGSVVGRTFTGSMYIKPVNSGDVGGNVYLSLQRRSGDFEGSTETIQIDSADWKRYEITYTFTGAGAGDQVGCDFKILKTGTPIDDIYVYGVQLEEGSFATSYIPTHGSSATRDQDVTGELQHGITMGTSCSVFFEGKHLAPNIGQLSFFQLKTDDSNRLLIYGAANTSSTYNLTVQHRVSGTATNSAAKSLNIGDSFKVLARMDDTTMDIFINGELHDTQTITAQDHFGKMNLYRTGATDQSGHEASQAILFTTALSNNDSEILTGATSYNSFADMATTLNYTIYE